jgi:hypothetical protein
MSKQDEQPEGLEQDGPQQPTLMIKRDWVLSEKEKKELDLLWKNYGISIVYYRAQDDVKKIDDTQEGVISFKERMNRLREDAPCYVLDDNADNVGAAMTAGHANKCFFIDRSKGDLVGLLQHMGSDLAAKGNSCKPVHFSPEARIAASFFLSLLVVPAIIGLIQAGKTKKEGQSLLTGDYLFCKGRKSTKVSPEDPTEGSDKGASP